MQGRIWWRHLKHYRWYKILYVPRASLRNQLHRWKGRLICCWYHSILNGQWTGSSFQYCGNEWLVLLYLLPGQRGILEISRWRSRRNKPLWWRIYWFSKWLNGVWPKEKVQHQVSYLTSLVWRRNCIIIISVRRVFWKIRRNFIKVEKGINETKRPNHNRKSKLWAKRLRV